MLLGRAAGPCEFHCYQDGALSYALDPGGGARARSKSELSTREGGSAAREWRLIQAVLADAGYDAERRQRRAMLLKAIVYNILVLFAREVCYRADAYPF